jgi:UDP-N-acetylglucosamine:LPS N-acetylglucosamine transferase
VQGGSRPLVSDGPARGGSLLAEQDPDEAAWGDVEVLWLGSIGGMEQALVTQAGIAYQGIRTGQIRGINPLKAISNAGRMAKGVCKRA